MNDQADFVWERLCPAYVHVNKEDDMIRADND